MNACVELSSFSQIRVGDLPDSSFMPAAVEWQFSPCCWPSS